MGTCMTVKLDILIDISHICEWKIIPFCLPLVPVRVQFCWAAVCVAMKMLHHTIIATPSLTLTPRTIFLNTRPQPVPTQFQN